MNQILDYNPGSNKSGGSSNSDKIVRVFAILIIIFALTLCGVGAYQKYKNSQDAKNAQTEETKANIEVIKQDSNVIIKVTHDKSIEKIIYSWNASSEKTIKGTGTTTMEQTVSLPAGENVLHVKVIDIKGVETTYENTFKSDSGVDIITPVIKISTPEGNKIKVQATDETSLDFLTYRWNNEEEEKVEPSEDNKKEISVEIEIKKGKNDLTIVAVDSNNNTTTETKSFTGVVQPEIVAVVSENGSEVNIKVTHEKGIKSISVEINGSQPIPVDLGGETPTDAEFPLPLNEGENKVKIVATSVEGIPATKEATFTYTPEPVQPGPTTEPKISMIQSEDGKLVSVRVEYEQGLKSVSLLFNEQEYQIDIGTDNPTQASFDLELAEGTNRVVVTSIGVDDSEGVLDQEYTYTPQ